MPGRPDRAGEPIPNGRLPPDNARAELAPIIAEIGPLDATGLFSDGRFLDFSNQKNRGGRSGGQHALDMLRHLHAATCRVDDVGGQRSAGPPQQRNSDECSAQHRPPLLPTV